MESATPVSAVAFTTSQPAPAAASTAHKPSLAVLLAWPIPFQPPLSAIAVILMATSQPLHIRPLLALLVPLFARPVRARPPAQHVSTI